MAPGANHDGRRRALPLTVEFAEDFGFGGIKGLADQVDHDPRGSAIAHEFLVAAIGAVDGRHVDGDGSGVR